MALKITIDNEYELEKIFNDWGRDYYSLDGYRAILDYFEETDCGEDTELDVIGICGDFTEYDDEELIDDFGMTTFNHWLEDTDKIYDWMYDNNFEVYKDMTDEEKIKMFDELKADFYGEYIEWEIEEIKKNHYIIELDNGNYLMVEF